MLQYQHVRGTLQDLATEVFLHAGHHADHHDERRAAIVALPDMPDHITAAVVALIKSQDGSADA